MNSSWIKLVIMKIKIIKTIYNPQFVLKLNTLAMDSQVLIPNQLINCTQILDFCTKNKQLALSSNQIREMFVVLAHQMIEFRKHREGIDKVYSQSSSTTNQQNLKPELSQINNKPEHQVKESKNAQIIENNLEQMMKVKISQIEDIQLRVAKIQSLINNTMQKKLEKQRQESQYPKNFVNTETSYFPLFEVQGKNIKYMEKDERTMILGKHSISQIGSFKIRIAHCVLSNIKIGICDSRYVTMRNCDQEVNMISMLGWNGEISTMHDYKSWKGIVFSKVGQTIEVKVDMRAGIITWLVDETEEQSIEWPLLHDRTIKWVPMVRLYDKGTAIQWIQG